MELATLFVGLAILCLAVAVVARDVVSSFVAGLVLAARRPFAVGDTIETGGFLGTVESLGRLATIGQSFAGGVVSIPNHELVTSTVVNHGGAGDRAIDITLGVGYREDLDELEHIAVEAARGIVERRQAREPELYYEGFGEGTVRLRLRFWINVDRHRLAAARSEAVKRIKLALAAAGITVPFPTRSLDFGAAGGTRLDEVLRDDRHWHGQHQRNGHHGGVIESDEIMSATAD